MSDEEKEGNEDNNEENEDNNEENEEKGENEEKEEDNDEEIEKDDAQYEEAALDKKNKKKKQSIKKFINSKLKTSTEIKIDLKPNDNNNNLVNNINNLSILTAAFGNNNPPPIQIASSHNIPPIPITSPLQIITDIKNDMDLLSFKITRNITPINSRKKFISFENNDNFFNYYDKEDYEMRKLINKANEYLNTNNKYTTYTNNNLAHNTRNSYHQNENYYLYI